MQELWEEINDIHFSLGTKELRAVKSRLYFIAQKVLKTNYYNRHITELGTYDYDLLKSIVKNMIDECRLREKEISKTNQEEVKVMKEECVENKKVFIVHGHDGELKYNVSHWLQKGGLEPIILHETANSGIATIMQKIEKNSDVGCAIILMTADDLGKAVSEDDCKKRPRQNVVFEAGYFLGKLGAERVIMLYDEGIEAPGDLSGCVYILADKYNGWREQVRKELKVIGIEYKD